MYAVNLTISEKYAILQATSEMVVCSHFEGDRIAVIIALQMCIALVFDAQNRGQFDMGVAENA